jgi:hypothetical protein
MPQKRSHEQILLSALLLGLISAILIGLLFSNFVIGLGVLATIGIVHGIIWISDSKLSEEPVQELKILVDLPPEVDVKVAPLILNRVDASLLAYLLKKCTVTDDHGKILLNYKRRGKIYDPKQCAFTIKGATYKPERLKILYCN